MVLMDMKNLLIHSFVAKKQIKKNCFPVIRQCVETKDNNNRDLSINPLIQNEISTLKYLLQGNN